MLHVIYNRISFLETNWQTRYNEELDTMDDMLDDIRTNFRETAPPKTDRAMLMVTKHKLDLLRANVQQGVVRPLRTTVVALAKFQAAHGSDEQEEDSQDNRADDEHDPNVYRNDNIDDEDSIIIENSSSDEDE
jgi:hypothetical protein